MKFNFRHLASAMACVALVSIHGMGWAAVTVDGGACELETSTLKGKGESSGSRYFLHLQNYYNVTSNCELFVALMESPVCGDPELDHYSLGLLSLRTEQTYDWLPLDVLGEKGRHEVLDLQINPTPIFQLALQPMRPRRAYWVGTDPNTNHPTSEAVVFNREQPTRLSLLLEPGVYSAAGDRNQWMTLRADNTLTVNGTGQYLVKPQIPGVFSAHALENGSFMGRYSSELAFLLVQLNGRIIVFSLDRATGSRAGGLLEARIGNSREYLQR